MTHPFRPGQQTYPQDSSASLQLMFKAKLTYIEMLIPEVNSSIRRDEWTHSRDSSPVKVQNTCTTRRKFSPISAHCLLAEVALGPVLNFIEWKPNVLGIHSDSWMHLFTPFHSRKVFHSMHSVDAAHDLRICSPAMGFWVVFSLGLR